MKKIILTRYFLIFSIFTLLATFFYVVQKSYDNLMKPINSAYQNPILRPIDPNLDVSVLETIQNKTFYSDNSQ